MGREHGYKIRNKSAPHFITFGVINLLPIFETEQYSEIFIDSLKYCQNNKGLILHSWCLMPNHTHLMFSAANLDPSEILRDFKKYTSKHIVEAIRSNNSEINSEKYLKKFSIAGKANSRNQNIQFWEQDNRPKELFGKIFIQQKLNYIHENPVKAFMVSRAEDYPYSSAVDYNGGKGILEIIKL
jgi:putative transposase